MDEYTSPPYSAQELRMIHQSECKQAMEHAFFITIAIVLGGVLMSMIVFGMYVSYTKNPLQFWAIVGTIAAPTVMWYGVYRYLRHKVDVAYAAKLMQTP
jgi:hypothetical protein